MDTSGFSWSDFFSGAGGLFDKYAAYRNTRTTNALQAEGQARAAAAAKAGSVPAWVMPAVVLGGVAVAVALIVRR